MRTKGLTALMLLLAACSSHGDERTPLSNVTQVTATGPLASAFSRAAEQTRVPRDLLVAIAVVEDGLGVPAVRLELHETNVPAAGPLMLRRGKLDALARGAALVGANEADLRRDADLALDAGARVLAELGARTGARTEDLASWRDAVEEMSGLSDEAHQDDYVHRVFATLARGGTFEGRDGENLTLGRHDLPPTLVLDVSSKVRALSGSAQFAGAEWIPTSCKNKCNTSRGGAEVAYVVVHDTEGGWEASVATLQNDPGKSVQYIIGTDGRTAQFVTEETTAWHAGNAWYNRRSIGIEHVGYANKPFAEKQYAASAKLVSHLAAKYGIAPDRAHVIGHDQIPDGTQIGEDSAPCSLSPSACQSGKSYGGASNHNDPGIWEWATYMPRVGGEAKCSDVSSRLRCSHDKASAFRCSPQTGGRVELLSCNGAGGCESRPGDQDDVCNVAPQAAPPEVSLPTPAPPPETNAADLPVAPLTEDAEPEDGCAVATSRGRTRDRGAMAALALGLAATTISRRRDRRRGART